MTQTTTDAPVDFFQPSRAYQSGRWQFQCLAVAPNPYNGETRAIGYLYRSDDVVGVSAGEMDSDDWETGEWTEITNET